MKLENIVSQEQLDKIIQEKADQSFKAGLDKGRNSTESSSEELEALRAEKKALEEKFNSAQQELKPYKEKEQYKADYASYIESGLGEKEVDLTNYNYKKFTKEDGKVDWEGFLEANQHLKVEKKPVETDITLEAQKRAEEELRKELESSYTKDKKLSSL